MPRSKPSSSTSSKPLSDSKKKRIINSKNTDCPASLSITIKQTTMKWSSDMLLKKYPCVIKVNHCHNHPVHAADALRRRRPSKKTEQKFTDLLKKGHSPLSALECHKLDRKMEYGDNYFKVAADASICPSNFWVYKLFTKLSIEGYGPQCGDKMLDALNKFCNDYNKANNSVCCKVELVDNHLVVAICTPLMSRVHTLIKASSEIMFVDSSGSMDSLNCRVFLMLTSSVAGGLPLGVLITTSESEKVVSAALELWKTLLPEKAFYGRGASIGPKLIMTDDATAERNALQMSFMTCILLLCLFHVLQAFWRFVWAREQNVPKDKRSELFYLFKDLVYAEDEETFACRLKDAMDSEELNKYPKVKGHLQKYIPRASEWALCMRSNLITRGHNTDNICEAGIKVLKDKVFHRLKAFNPVQLCDFILTRYDNYLQNRIIDVINNRAINQVKSRFYIRPEKLTDLECEELERPNSYLVKNLTKGTTNYVVMDYEICSCEAGKSGRPCKHLCAVVMKYKLTSSVIHPLLQCDNPAVKRVLFEVAHGHNNCPEEWFSSIFNENSNAETIQEPQSSLEAEETLVESSDNLNEVRSNVDEISPEIIQETEMALSEIFSSWSSSLRTDPATFLRPIESFIKNNESVSKSQSSLLSAMHCFGKSGGVAAIGIRQKKLSNMPVQSTAGVSAIGIRQKNLSNMPVQSTAPARRTTYIGGRTAQFCGRPPNAMTAALDQDQQEHCYGNTQKGNKTDEPTYAHLPKRPRIAAPHDLQLCVQTSRMVGK
ncbi:uncharacterized protein LOC117646104 [Thrips palmi]|uniref:Uncharacterized protein LOC117646104 n=1 Tax=Thrips palmi TaxID=161013 RepID=A0A6P8ZNP3_THRPL|nr:uncharacterized protein LOC117646104 [Thrips palmi]